MPASDPADPSNAGLKVESINDQGEVVYDLEQGIIRFSGGAILSYSNVVLRAEQGWADVVNNRFHAEGSVTVERAGEIWKGEIISYDSTTGQIEAESFRVGQYPFFAEGSRLSTDPETGAYKAENAYITTDDVETPFPKLKAREILMVPGESLAAEGAVLELGQTPVMYFPRIKLSTQASNNRLELRPGVRSRYGAFLRTGYELYDGEKTSTIWHTDVFSERGLGLGPGFSYDLGDLGGGEFSGYYINDLAPENDVGGLDLPRDRHRIHWSQRLKLDERLTTTLVVNDQSDPLFNRDFFESEFRNNPQAPSHFEMLKWWDNYSLSVYAQPQVDSFFETVERLPQVRFNSYRQQIGELPLYYENESKAGWYRRRFADGDPSADFEAIRADTFHQVVSPHMIGGWLSVMPKTGFRFTHYGEAKGPGGVTDKEERWLFHSGVELSTRISRTWSGASSDFWNVDGLRHIIYPSLNYLYVPNPNVKPTELPQFDSYLPSLRLLPIDFPDNNSIDSLGANQVLRLGLRNKFQTHREGGIQDLMHWAVFTDWRLDPDRGQSTFSDLYSDMDLRPRSWLILNSEIQYNMKDAYWAQANHTLTILPGNRWSWTLGHRFVRDDLFPGATSGNNLFVNSLYYRLNENWGARATHQYESRDGVLEEQEYSLYRDFRSWTASFVFRVRDRRRDTTEYRMGVQFSFKAFPRFSLGGDSDRARTLMGGEESTLY